MNNATCVAKYEEGDYHCACAPGFIGEHCETGISAHQFGILGFYIVSHYYTLSCIISYILLDLLYNPPHFIDVICPKQSHRL